MESHKGEFKKKAKHFIIFKYDKVNNFCLSRQM